MKPATDSNLYFAKATLPYGSQWKSAWTTKENAEKLAQNYCDDWSHEGLATAEACVFYRDGQIVSHFKVKNKRLKCLNCGGKLIKVPVPNGTTIVCQDCEQYRCIPICPKCGAELDEMSVTCPACLSESDDHGETIIRDEPDESDLDEPSTPTRP